MTQFMQYAYVFLWAAIAVLHKLSHSFVPLILYYLKIYIYLIV